jgi:DNA polymerase-3 subunit delta
VWYPEREPATRESESVLLIFFGDNDFAMNGAVEELRKRVGPPEVLEVNSHRFDASEVAFNEVRAACETVPFMAESRLVIVRGLLSLFEPYRTRGRRTDGPSVRVAKEWSGLEEMVANMAPATILVLLDGRLTHNNPLLEKLRPHAAVREVPYLSDNDLARWMKKQVAGLESSITPGALTLLVQWVGRDQWVLSSELEKLSLYAADRAITEGDVRALVPQVREASIFAAVDGLMDGRLALATQILQRLRAEGIGFSRISAILERQLRTVLLAKELLDGGARPEEVGRRLNISLDFVLRRVVQQARRLSWERLESFHGELLKADLAIKRGQLDEELALDLLLSRFSRPAGVRHP